MDNKFDKNLRLLKSEDFKKVFSKQQVAIKNPFLVFYCLNNLPYSRIGFAINKKRVRKANKRNLIKRVVREVFRTNKLIHSNEYVQGNTLGIDFVILILVKNDANLLDNKEELAIRFLFLIKKNFKQ